MTHGEPPVDRPGTSPLRAMPAMPPAINVMGLPIRPLDIAELIVQLVARARTGVRTTACYANAHTVNLAWRDRSFRDALAASDLLFADGASVVWASRWSAARLPERMTACDYFPLLAAACAEAGVSMYLLGNRPGIAERAAERLKAAMPKLRIAGAHHGHFDPTESTSVIERINASGADLLIVGMSSPRQERWLIDHADALTPPVRLCVGALLDYVAGVERRGPAWLCRLGGEWLFRLLVDPIGKWRRYVLGNPTFVWNLIRWRWQARRRGSRVATGALAGRADSVPRAQSTGSWPQNSRLPDEIMAAQSRGHATQT